jgi:hypothetical protein
MRFIALILISVTGFCRQSYAGFVAETLSSDSMLGRESGTPSAALPDFFGDTQNIL